MLRGNGLWGISMRRLAEESVFGMASDLNATAGATVFIGLIFLLVCLEIGFSKVEHWSEHNQSKELFEKLKKELTMMGILSFTVFVYQTAYSAATESDYYEAFEMSHIVILFIAIAFIIQASFLLHFAIAEGDNFLKMSRTTPDDLLIQYRNMKATNPNQSWFFEKAPYWFPTIPSFRNDIRAKLIESLFINQHKLPDEFRFAQYISKLFQKYISELGEVSPINWLLLGGLVALNFLKISTIDEREVEYFCGEAPAEPVRRFLQEGDGGDGETGSEEGVICYQYIFSYAFTIILLLFIFILGVYVAASYYFEELLHIACKRQGVAITNETGRLGYITVLEKMSKVDQTFRMKSTNSNPDTKVKVFKEIHASSNATERRYSVKKTEGISEAATETIHSPLLDENCEDDFDTERKDIRDALIEEQMEELHELEEEKEESKDGCYKSCLKHIKHMFSSESEKGNLQTIFWLNSSGIFFSMVELVLLLQCFYIAMWGSQLIPMIVNYEESEVGWIILFTVPMFINFVFIRLILTRAVMLQAICGVHAEVLGEVKEETIEEEHCLDKLRKAVRHRFAHDIKDANGKLDPTELSDTVLTSMKVKMKAYFNKYDDDGSGDIGQVEFVQLLTDLKVYISKRAFKILWNAIDFDLSGGISWDELFVILFPELKSIMKQELQIVGVLRSAISDKLIALNIRSNSKMTEYMQSEFNKFDADKSGSIDESEMLTLVKEYLPDMDEKQAKRLFAAIDVDGEGGIEWDEFRELIFGVAQIQDKRLSNWI